MRHCCNHCQNSQGCYCYWDLVCCCFCVLIGLGWCKIKKTYVRDNMVDSVTEQHLYGVPSESIRYIRIVGIGMRLA